METTHLGQGKPTWNGNDTGRHPMDSPAALSSQQHLHRPKPRTETTLSNLSASLLSHAWDRSDALGTQRTQLEWKRRGDGRDKRETHRNEKRPDGIVGELDGMKEANLRGLVPNPHSPVSNPHNLMANPHGPTANLRNPMANLRSPVSTCAFRSRTCAV